MCQIDLAREFIDQHPAKAEAIAYTMAAEDAGEIAADDLDAITETGIRTGLSTNQRSRVERLVEKFAAEAEEAAARDSRESYERVLERV